MSLCCASSGGTLRLTIDGTVYAVRGSATVNPAKYDISAESNMDGSLYTTYKPVPVKAEFALSDSCGLSIKQIQSAQCVDATLELDAVGKTYIFVGAAIVGMPSLNIETGEISGLSLVAADTREIHDDAVLTF